MIHTLSNEKLLLSKHFIVILRVVIRVKLVVLTAVGPPGLSTVIAKRNSNPLPHKTFFRLVQIQTTCRL